jgi:hypothetical protein
MHKPPTSKKIGKIPSKNGSPDKFLAAADESEENVE